MLENDIVMTFSIHSVYDDVQRQSIEVLGSQTLASLQEAICKCLPVGYDTRFHPSNACGIFSQTVYKTTLMRNPAMQTVSCLSTGTSLLKLRCVRMVALKILSFTIPT